jgi:ankyrin repeat protein
MEAVVFHVEVPMSALNLPEIVQSMLRLGAHINDQDDENRTPLHRAVQANHYDFAKRLIERGANIMVKA